MPLVQNLTACYSWSSFVSVFPLILVQIWIFFQVWAFLSANPSREVLGFCSGREMFSRLYEKKKNIVSILVYSVLLHFIFFTSLHVAFTTSFRYLLSASPKSYLESHCHPWCLPGGWSGVVQTWGFWQASSCACGHAQCCVHLAWAEQLSTQKMQMGLVALTHTELCWFTPTERLHSSPVLPQFCAGSSAAFHWCMVMSAKVNMMAMLYPVSENLLCRQVFKVMSVDFKGHTA